MRLWNGKYVPRSNTKEKSEKVEFALNNPSMYEVTKELFESKENDDLE